MPAPFALQLVQLWNPLRTTTAWVAQRADARYGIRAMTRMQTTNDNSQPLSKASRALTHCRCELFAVDWESAHPTRLHKPALTLSHSTASRSATPFHYTGLCGQPTVECSSD